MSFPSFIQSPTAISAAGFASGSWNIGIASGAPAGATGMAVLLVGNAGGGSIAREFRKTGSTDNYIADALPASEQVVRFVGLNGSQQFDYYSGAAATGDLIYPLAYFGPEATFPTNIIVMASTLTTSFATYGTGGNAPGGIAAVFAIHGGGDYDTYFRHPSSTDAFQNGNESAAGRRDFFCALDGTQEYAAISGNAGRQPYLVCYFTSNVTCNTNAVARTPGTAGSYQNLSTAGDTSPIGHMYYLRSPSTSYTYQLSGQGTSWTAPNVAPAATLAGPGLAYSPAQANIQNLALIVSELAYFTASAPVSVAWLI